MGTSLYGEFNLSAKATSGNSVAILENKVVDKIGYPRAVYNDNGSHFKKLFAAHLAEKEVKQYFAPHHPPAVCRSR